MWNKSKKFFNLKSRFKKKKSSSKIGSRLNNDKITVYGDCSKSKDKSKILNTISIEKTKKF